MDTAFAVGATLVAVAFCLSTAERWLVRRARHEAAWTVALALFALAAGTLAAGSEGGWSGAAFRLFYLAGAVLDVPVLAIGTLYLLGGRRVGDTAAVAVAVGAGFAAGVLLSAPFTHALPVHRLPQGSQVFGPLPRVLAAVGSGGGSVVVLGGSLWSAWRTRRTSGRRAVGNLLIAAGTLVTGAGGLLQSVADQATAFAVSLAVGVAILFTGFLVASGSTAPITAHGPVAGAGTEAAGAGAAGARSHAGWVRNARRKALPVSPRGSSSTKRTDAGHL